MQEVSSSFETRLHSKYSHKIILNLVTIHRGHTDIITCLPFRYLESRRHTQVQFTALVVPCCCFSMANFISKASTLKHKTACDDIHHAMWASKNNLDKHVCQFGDNTLHNVHCCTVFQCGGKPEIAILQN